MSERATRASDAAMDSQSRLAAVDRARRLLDGQREWAGVLARMVSGALGVRGAQVSVLDDRRQFLVGAHGMDAFPGAARDPEHGVPLDTTLCRCVVAEGMPVIVNDTATDRRAPAGIPVGAYAGFPVRDGDGELVGAVCALHDRPTTWTPQQLAILDDAAQLVAAGISHDAGRVRLAGFQEADRQRAFLDALLDSLQTGVAAVDNDGRMVLFNRALRELTGIETASTDPLQWPTRPHVFHPDGRPVETADLPLVRALGGETVRNVEQLLHQPGRRPRLFGVNAQPITGADGRQLGAMSTVHEITERRRAEAFRACELACSHALASAADATEAGHAVLEAVATTLGWPYAELWLVEPHAYVLRPAATWTAAGCGITMDVPAGLAPGEDLAGSAWHTRVPQWVTDLADPGPHGSRETGTGRQLRTALAIPVRSGDRVTGVLQLFAGAAEEPEDELIVLLLGITAQIGQFLERRRAEDLALQLADTKDEYIALVGHELRTPLTSIASYTELLDGCPDGTTLAEVRDLIDVIKRNNTQLRGTIGDLLDLAALDAGHADLNRQTVDVAAVVRDALAAIAPAARTQQVTMRPDLPERCGIHGDPLRLRQVVDNLLHNAVKYSPDGGTVTVALHTDGGTLALVVADTGIGIPADERHRIFSRFYRSSRARGLGIPGTGLGLAISAIIVERHGGTITLQPPAGPGTTMRIELPLSAATA